MSNKRSKAKSKKRMKLRRESVKPYKVRVNEGMSDADKDAIMLQSQSFEMMLERQSGAVDLVEEYIRRLDVLMLVERPTTARGISMVMQAAYNETSPNKIEFMESSGPTVGCLEVPAFEDKPGEECFLSVSEKV